jgi:preprotein translocase subunit SecG
MIGVIKTVLSVLFVLISLAITVLVLMQEGKQAGLSGSVSGAADTYWGKNKGRSVEGALEKATTILGILFIVIALVLNLGIFA